ncbi:hypothetical protein CLV28_1092 [Sediminihabitans luteus]|uniref:Aromatic acid exporter family member 1 n=1 Tax=Sediminihabitans luteus TaxID=1138585 RepID=A0A2M9D0Z1_9CELL|nr:hypothetical protein [Sediminihabitans luteus]PJJ77866.1 hypothetical protein CLV28_1092 [Sediminihabitans luteus]GII99776.1 hypothetical protein Slu03_21540 [Sediminihabitans luteus]
MPPDPGAARLPDRPPSDARETGARRWRDGWVGRAARAADRLWARHPRWSMAFKGAFAAALAWFVALLLPAPISDFAYYAPLGAVVATNRTVVGSAVSGLQAAGAVVAGAVIARLADLVLAPGAIAIAVVVGAAILLAGWRGWGMLGDWVVTSSLIVLIIGNTDKLGFVGAYAGLVALGAAIGALVNALAPPLLIVPSAIELDRLRDRLADQLDAVVDGLRASTPPADDEWEERRREIRPVLARATAAVEESREAARGNVRARRRSGEVHRLLVRAEALRVTAEMVEDVSRLVMRWESDGRDELAFGASVRPDVADALATYADVLRSDPGRAAEVRDVADHLRTVVRGARDESEEDFFVAGTLVLALRRGADALATLEDDAAG